MEIASGISLPAFMDNGLLTVRAVLCDIYKTLLDVGPAPADAGGRWDALCHRALPDANPLALDEFRAAAERAIAREHAGARDAGIPHPEVFWPDMAREAWPALAFLRPDALDDFLFEHAQLERRVRLMPGAGDVLRALAARGTILGLVSNSQPYTLRELDAALAAADLTRALFAPGLCFFSFDHGFSKPDPHVVRLLTARLRRIGIRPADALMVGDREDNDIVPARAAGFRTWQLTGDKPGPRDGARDERGDWRALAAALGLSLPG